VGINEAVAGNKAFPEMDDSIIRPTVELLDTQQELQQQLQQQQNLHEISNIDAQGNSQQAPWLVNNSLARNNSTGGLLGRTLRSKATAAIVPSATMPNLVRNPGDDNRSVGSIRTLQGQGVPATVLHARMPDMSMKGKQSSGNIYYERQIDRLNKEITSLEIQLDDAFREKEVTRLEMDRMRNILMRFNNERRLVADNVRRKTNVAEGSGVEVWMEENMSKSLTSADMAQALSDADKLALSLQPNSKISPFAAKPNSSQGGMSKKEKSSLPVIPSDA
jgi:hypothetical protein